MKNLLLNEQDAEHEPATQEPADKSKTSSPLHVTPFM